MTDESNAGKPARVINGVETIGPPECPLMTRRTVISNRFCKLLLHSFFPNASDKSPHDHPRSFFTFVYRGGYADISHGPDGEYVGDEVRAPALRFRRAEHAHITVVHGDGAKSIVLMGPLRREWGFWHDGSWWPWRRFEQVFGVGFRCDDEGER